MVFDLYCEILLYPLFVTSTVKSNQQLFSYHCSEYFERITDQRDLYLDFHKYVDAGEWGHVHKRRCAFLWDCTLWLWTVIPSLWFHLKWDHSGCGGTRSSTFILYLSFCCMDNTQHSACLQPSLSVSLLHLWYTPFLSLLVLFLLVEHHGLHVKSE